VPDEASALETAIKQFDIRPEDQKRSMAVRHQRPATIRVWISLGFAGRRSEGKLLFVVRVWL
jgi:hypothetical protein